MLEGPRSEAACSVLAGGRAFARKQCGNLDILGAVKPGFILFIFRFTLYRHTLANLCCVSGAAVTLGEVWCVVGLALPM